jgi:citrate lyase subunit beta/citryl-CoA lyase
MTNLRIPPGEPTRSILFAPANHARRVARALASAADIVVLDLEDAIPAAEKESARAIVTTQLQVVSHTRVYVRTNHPTDTEFDADLACLEGCHLAGLVIPKVDGADEIAELNARIDAFEQRTDRPVGSIEIIPIIESAAGIVHCEAIALASPRIRRLIFGGADYSLDMGLSLDWTADEHELLYARCKITHASRAARLEPPIDTATLQVRDLDRFLRSASNARTLGFQGKLCLHPDQIEPCHAAFMPSERDISAARRVLAAWSAAATAGSGAIEVDGHFVDEPVAERARRLLKRAGREDQ